MGPEPGAKGPGDADRMVVPTDTVLPPEGVGRKDLTLQGDLRQVFVPLCTSVGSSLKWGHSQKSAVWARTWRKGNHCALLGTHTGAAAVRHGTEGPHEVRTRTPLGLSSSSSGCLSKEIKNTSCTPTFSVAFSPTAKPIP